MGNMIYNIINYIKNYIKNNYKKIVKICINKKITMPKLLINKIFKNKK